MAEIEHGGFFRQPEQIVAKTKQRDEPVVVSPTEVEDGKAVVVKEEATQEQGPPEQKPTEQV